MAQKNDAQLLEELKNFDTPSITNVVATYPSSPLCLGLYNPWTENWYTDQTIRCMYPELGRLAGYAVTCVYGLPDPNYGNRLSFMDVIDALEAMPKPTILVLQQKFPPELAGKVGLAGGNMVSAMKALGCVGLISNGPSRDLDEVRPMKFQYMLTGVTAGHGAQAVQAVNVPVSVGGMDVAPGEIIHMDENGAVKFPANKLEAVVTNARALQKEEETRMAALQAAKSAAEVRAIMSGHAYAAADEEAEKAEEKPSKGRRKKK
jgi:4-hydroxy-4-methyl-2-oxoglutarate aldolase